MKHIIRVTIQNKYDEFLAKKYKDKVKFYYEDMVFYVEDHSDDLNNLMEYIETKQLHFYLSHELQTENEENVLYYNIFPSFPKRINQSPAYGVKFSFECEYCGYNPVQLGPACFPIKYARNCDFFKVDPLLIISKRMKEALEEIGATGGELKKVIDYKTKKETSDFFQLAVTSQLPPSDPKWIFQLGMCRKCERKAVRYMGPPGYRLEDFKGMKDFYFTSERDFSTPAYIVPMNYLIVSRRVMDLMKNLNCALSYVRDVYIEEQCQ